MPDGNRMCSYGEKLKIETLTEKTTVPEN